jgi:GrpB-like predicted nucleotidyltransferase (UPF0157 family)
MELSSDRTPVVVVAYDPDWPEQFETLRNEILGRLPNVARAVLHIGSTAVPGLAAKPVIDIALIVNDSSDESAYLPPLVDAGYRLVVREPDWHEHRMFKREKPAVNLHVYSRDCDEVERVVRFRDWLRTHEDDRDLYAATKQDLAAQQWERVQDYADAKNDVVEDIMTRALAGEPPADSHR